MRILFAVVAALGLSVAAASAEPQSYDERLLPRDEAGLQALDRKQLRIVRRATALCNASDPYFVRARAMRRPCIIGDVDHAIADSDDPALQAYHAALPFHVRYDRFRPAYYYQQMLVRYRR